MKKPLIYISGPMAVAPGSSYTANIRRGIDAAEAIERLWGIPYLPHTQALWGIVYPGKPESTFMERDLAFVDACHALVRIPGESKGADIEERLALEIGKPIFHVVLEPNDGQPDCYCYGWGKPNRGTNADEGLRLINWIQDFAK